MKKILATILALVLALGLCSVSWADGEGEGGTTPSASTTVVAKIGEQGYATLQAAVEAATDGQTIVLVAGTAEDITVANGKDITIDLNGKTVKNVTSDTITVELGAKLTITGTGTGTVDNVTHGKAALINNGTATLDGGTYMRSQEDDGNSKDSPGNNSYYTIVNASGAAMTINAGVSVTNKGNFSSMIRNGGTGDAIATMTINGGTFNGGINSVKNDSTGVLTINDGNFSNTSQYVIMNWHQATINNGTFQANGTAKAVLFTSKYEGATADGELTVNNGTFIRTSDAQKMIRDYYDDDNKGTAAISGGTFKDAEGKAVDVSAYLVAGKQQNSDGSVGNKSYYYYPSTSDTTTSTTTKGSPKTFDAGVGIYAVTAVLSVTGMAWTAKKRH